MSSARSRRRPLSSVRTPRSPMSSVPTPSLLRLVGPVSARPMPRTASASPMPQSRRDRANPMRRARKGRPSPMSSVTHQPKASRVGAPSQRANQRGSSRARPVSSRTAAERTSPDARPGSNPMGTRRRALGPSRSASPNLRPQGPMPRTPPSGLYRRKSRELQGSPQGGPFLPIGQTSWLDLWQKFAMQAGGRGVSGA